MARHMTLRIGCDMDGVLADFASAYDEVHEHLFGPAEPARPGSPEDEPEERESPGDVAGGEAIREPAAPTPRLLQRQRDAVWAAIRDTPDFWTTLAPLDLDAVRRIHEMMLRHRWEVFFITQRPATAGDTVQRQTQRWLVQQGFDLPSVLVIAGSRGAAAGALRLDYHVDDSPTNCIDVKSESGARPILIVPDGDATVVSNARKLKIGTARTISECLDILEQASSARSKPTLLRRIASLVGWS
jgi:hypothetical protein